MQKAVSAVLGLVVLGSLSVAPVSGIAQNQDEKIIESLDLDQADVRDALKIIFKHVGYSYSVDPAVQGTIVIHIEKKPFETVLRNVLNQVEATYRIEGGIYNIVPRPTPVENPDPIDTGSTTQAQTIRRIPIRHADPSLVIRILAGQADIGDQPETSALQFGGGQGGFGGGGMSGGGFSGGGGFGGGGFSGGFGGGGMSGGFGGGGFGGGLGGGGFGGGGGGFGGGRGGGR
jgi:hypothetical protein